MERNPCFKKSGTLYVFLSTAYGDSRLKYPSVSPMSRITSALVESSFAYWTYAAWCIFVDAEPVTR
jgi:hypothetical protein